MKPETDPIPEPDMSKLNRYNYRRGIRFVHSTGDSAIRLLRSEEAMIESVLTNGAGVKLVALTEDGGEVPVDVPV